MEPFIEAINQNKTLRKKYDERGRDINSFEFMREYYENYAVAKQAQHDLIKRFEDKREAQTKRKEAVREKPDKPNSKKKIEESPGRYSSFDGTLPRC